MSLTRSGMPLLMVCGKKTPIDMGCLSAIVLEEHSLSVADQLSML